MTAAQYWPFGHRTKWDTATIADHLDGLGLPVTEAPLDVDVHAVVVPAGDVRPREVNDVIADLGPTLLVLASDERSRFDWTRIRRRNDPDLTMWVMTPRIDRHDGIPHGTRYIGEGMPPQTLELLAPHRDLEDSKPVDVFLAAQNTHRRRHDCFAAARDLADHGDWDVTTVETPGFLQGLDRADYLADMASAKIALCPAGSTTPDTFRLWEALTAGCVPIVDGLTSDDNYPAGYWSMVAPGAPFPIITDWAAELAKTVEAVLADWEALAVRCGAWWAGRLAQERVWVRDDVRALGG